MKKLTTAELIKLIPGITIHLDDKKTCAVTQSSVGAVFDMFTQSPNIKTELNEYQFNERHDGDSRFCGGTKEQFIAMGRGELDQAAFLKARKTIAAQMRELNTEELFTARKRERFYSEHDGEFDRDRLFEIRPFASTRILNNGIVRTLDVSIDFSFHCGVTAAAINRYGAMAWSIVDLIESNGIQCSLTIQVQGYGFERGKDSFNSQKILINVKRPGDYVDSLTLARCFTTQFYRRGVFTLYVAACDRFEQEAPHSLGTPRNTSSFAERGKLHIGNEHADTPDLARLLKFVKTSLTNGVKDDQ
jgi:hypothetical protein